MANIINVREGKIAVSEFQLNRAYIPGISTAHDRRSFNFSFYQRINMTTRRLTGLFNKYDDKKADGVDSSLWRQCSRYVVYHSEVTQGLFFYLMRSRIHSFINQAISFTVELDICLHSHRRLRHLKRLREKETFRSTEYQFDLWKSFTWMIKNNRLRK